MCKRLPNALDVTKRPKGVTVEIETAATLAITVVSNTSNQSKYERAIELTRPDTDHEHRQVRPSLAV